MSPIKRKRLRQKRTPWAKSRYARRARAFQRLQKRVIAAQGANLMAQIRSTPADGNAAKQRALAECFRATMLAVENVPLYGAMKK